MYRSLRALQAHQSAKKSQNMGFLRVFFCDFLGYFRGLLGGPFLRVSCALGPKTHVILGRQAPNFGRVNVGQATHAVALIRKSRSTFF